MTNNFVGIGRVTASAELKYTQSNVACVKFSLCINKSYKKGGEWISKPNFFDCVIWGKYGEAMQKHITKGRLVSVICELDQERWEDKQGNKHNAINFVVSNIELLDKRKDGKDEKVPQNEGGHGGSEMPPDDVPF